MFLAPVADIEFFITKLQLFGSCLDFGALPRLWQFLLMLLSQGRRFSVNISVAAFRYVIHHHGPIFFTAARFRPLRLDPIFSWLLPESWLDYETSLCFRHFTFGSVAAGAGLVCFLGVCHVSDFLLFFQHNL